VWERRVWERTAPAHRSRTQQTELVAETCRVSHTMLVRERTRLQRSTLRIPQGRSAKCVQHSLLLSGALVSQQVHPVLAGEAVNA